jgi:hypothetical protein
MSNYTPQVTPYYPNMSFIAKSFQSKIPADVPIGVKIGPDYLLNKEEAEAFVKDIQAVLKMMKGGRGYV